MDAIVTYGWNRVAYNVLRSLSNHGLSVIIGDKDRFNMSFFSRFAKLKFIYPSFYSDPKGFVESIKCIYNKYKPKVYIPIHEETFVASKFKNEIQREGLIVPVADFNKLLNLHLKDRVSEIAKNLNIPIPQTLKPKNLTDVKHFAREFGFPVVIKLLQTNSAKGVFYAHNEKELSGICEEFIEKQQNFLLQEYVKGEGYGVSLLFNNGSLRAFFTHKRLREKIVTGGTSTRRMSTRNKILEEYAIRLLNSIKWHGVAMVEFKYNERFKKGWLIEVNPRFWGSLALAIHSGVDFPYLLFKMAIEGDIKPVFDYKTGVITRWVLGDIIAAFNYVRNLKSVAPLINFFKFNKNEKFDDLYRDDIKVFFAEAVHYFIRTIRAGSFNPTKEALLDVTKL